MHKTKSSLKLFAAFAVALGLALSALTARLWSGPISIAFMTPYLQKALLLDHSDLTLRFDNTFLALEGLDGEEARVPALKIRLTNVRLYDQKGNKLLVMPSGSVGLSIQALLHGMIAPSSLEIVGPNLHVDWRGEDILGDFGGAGEGGAMLAALPVAVQEASTGILPLFIRELLSPPGDNSPTGYLRRIRIIDANLTLHELISNSRWVVPKARLEFARSKNGVLLRADGSLQKTGMQKVRLKVTGTYNGHSHQTDLKVAFRGLNPARLAGRSQTMSGFRAVDLPIDGVVFVVLGAGHRIVSAGFDLDSGPGQIIAPRIYAAPLHFDQIKAKGRYDRKLKQFSLDRLSLLFGSTRFAGQALIYAGSPGLGLQVNGDITDLPLVSLKDYWPHALATGGYDWVSRNITGGTATSGHLDLHIAPDMWAQAVLPPDVLDFRFKFTGVAAHYLRPMPPITEGVGFARLTTRSFDLTVTDAQVAGLKMGLSHVHFSGLHLPNQTLAKIDAHLTGPLDKALALIDSDPLGYPTQYGLEPESVSGKSDVQLTFDFPLRRSITLKDVQFDVLADVQNMAMPHLFDTIALDQGNLKMHVDRQGLATTGKIALNTVPFDFTWKENFGATQVYPTIMTLAGPIAGNQWTALGLPGETYIKGPALLNATLRGKGARILVGEGKLDLGRPEISLDQLGWVKPAGAKADLAFKLERDGASLNLTEVDYRDKKLSARGSLRLDPNDNLEKAVLAHLKYGRTEMSASLVRKASGQYAVFVRAPVFDARQLIKKATTSEQEDSDADLGDFTLNAQIGHLLAKNGVSLRGVKAEAAYGKNIWKRLKISGKFDNEKAFSFALSPSATGRTLAIASDDAGQAGRAIGLFGNAVGGTLSVTGNLTGPAKTQQLKGEVQVKDFKVAKAPVLGNILTIGSMSGIDDMLKGDGLAFERLDIPFTFQNGAITLEKSRAYGPSIGLTMEGGIDLRYNSLNLKGTIIPAYTLNSVLKFMPLVGNLLMGGKGEGLFALTYKITGPVAAPKVDVNPLAVLAPGFLRSIMSAFAGAGPSISPQRKAAEKAAAEAAEKARINPPLAVDAKALAVPPVDRKPVPPQP